MNGQPFSQLNDTSLSINYQRSLLAKGKRRLQRSALNTVLFSDKGLQSVTECRPGLWQHESQICIIFSTPAEFFQFVEKKLLRSQVSKWSAVDLMVSIQYHFTLNLCRQMAPFWYFDILHTNHSCKEILLNCVYNF